MSTVTKETNQVNFVFTLTDEDGMGSTTRTISLDDTSVTQNNREAFIQATQQIRAWITSDAEIMPASLSSIFSMKQNEILTPTSYKDDIEDTTANWRVTDVNLVTVSEVRSSIDTAS